MTTQILPTDHPELSRDAVDAAVRLLAAGEVVALPTETVYGLAADALNADAVAKIFSVKERPSFDPLIVHLPHKDDIELSVRAQRGSSRHRRIRFASFLKIIR